MSAPTPLVLVTVGTDHHPFVRLLDWVHAWAAGRDEPVECVVQHGYSPAPGVPGETAFLDHGQLQSLLARAAAVVTHGGPASILEARRHGHLPLCVPRDPSLGEHVDGHQVAFVDRIEQDGLVVRCRTQAQLHQALDERLAEPAEAREAVLGAMSPPPGILAMSTLVDTVVREGGSPLLRGMPSRLLGRPAGRPQGEPASRAVPWRS